MSKTGVIKTIVGDRGFAFIVRDGQTKEEKDLFFHSKDVVGVTFDDLKVGDKVSFDEVTGPKGQGAQNVERI